MDFNEKEFSELMFRMRIQWLIHYWRNKKKG